VGWSFGLFACVYIYREIICGVEFFFLFVCVCVRVYIYRGIIYGVEFWFVYICVHIYR